MSQTPVSGEVVVSGAVVSDATWVEAHVETLQDVVNLYRELRETRAKLAAVEALAGELNATSSHSDYGDGRWDVADRVLRIIHGE